MLTQKSVQVDSDIQVIKKQMPVKIEKFDNINENPIYLLTKDIFIPLFVLFLGGVFTWSQFFITNQRQDADSLDKARETKEQVLSEYGKTIQELFVTKSNLGLADGDNDDINKDKINIARGQTLIALRRLNVFDNKSSDNKSEIDAGKLKGLLIRYLYDAQLIGYGYSSSNKPSIMTLSGADTTNVVLEDAWLPRIDLHNAWLENSNFKNASLWHANLKDARLTGADLTGADLRFAALQSATLEKSTLTNACYVEGRETEYFPSDFKPGKFKMVAIPEDQSDPSQTNFKSCQTAPTP